MRRGNPPDPFIEVSREQWLLNPDSIDGKDGPLEKRPHERTQVASFPK
jgi:hypothetical protein